MYEVTNYGLCGECKHHKYITDRNYGFMGYSKEEWICNNKRSNAYALPTDYTDTCEEWEGRE